MIKGWKAAAILVLAFGTYTAVDMLGAPFLWILYSGVAVSAAVNFPAIMRVRF